jgi:murein hydrolase activator
VEPYSKTLISFAIATICVVGSGLDSAVAQLEETQELQAIRDDIRMLEDRLEEQQAEQLSAVIVLREAELAVAEASGVLRSSRAELTTLAARRSELEVESRRATTGLEREREGLAQQARVRFATGRQEVLKFVLNQESPARLGRMMIYHDYLSRARSRHVAVIHAEIERLDELAQATARATRDLELLEQRQVSQLETFERSRRERGVVLAGLARDIETSGGEIQNLRNEEQRLAELVDSLESSFGRLLPDSADAFDGVTGKLAWPVSGTLVSDFGQSRAGGQLTWNGVVVGAPGGTPVRAVYHGRVVFSDWLPGLGLLLILDHGAGYMSLYGHNEALLKNSGDWVLPGEVIAHVGDSGGQAETALYFEIRQDGEPINPRPWMAQSLPPGL